MSKHIIKIMGIPFQNRTQKTFVEEEIVPALDQGNKRFIVTANPEIVMETQRNSSYKEIVLSADYVVPDGVGVLLAAKRKGQPLLERIAGFDLMVDLLHLANERKARCYFLGGTREVNDRMVRRVKEQFPSLKIVGSHHGYFDIHDPKVFADVKNSDADFVFVALGFPKQEEWIAKHLPEFSKGIFMGVGGSFDVLSGKVKRAPDIWIKLNLEWLYRLLKQPSRWKRTFPIIKFFILTLLGRI